MTMPYCSKECLAADWPRHKHAECTPVGSSPASDASTSGASSSAASSSGAGGSSSNNKKKGKGKKR